MSVCSALAEEAGQWYLGRFIQHWHPSLRGEIIMRETAREYSPYIYNSNSGAAENVMTGLLLRSASEKVPSKTSKACFVLLRSCDSEREGIRPSEFGPILSLCCSIFPIYVKRC